MNAFDTKVLDPGYVRDEEGQTKGVCGNLHSSSTSIELVAEEQIQMMLVQEMLQGDGSCFKEIHKDQPVLLHGEGISSISSSRFTSFTALPSLSI